MSQAITWATRHEAQKQEQAIQALADLPKTQSGILVYGDESAHADLLGRASEFAALWKIPFDAETTQNLAETREGEKRNQNEEWENSGCW